MSEENSPRKLISVPESVGIGQELPDTPADTLISGELHSLSLKPGRLTVRCVRAWNLAPGDPRRLFRAPTSDPYVELSLKDAESGMRSKPKKTNIIPRTLNPKWNQEFSWQLKQPSSALMLHLDVWDHDEDKDDDFLGQASKPLSPDFLEEAASKIQTCELSLEADDRSRITPTGKVQVEIIFELEAVIFAGPQDQLTLTKMLRKPPVLRVAAMALNGMSGLLLVVATVARWLCEGDTMPGCQVVAVPGTSCCCIMAAGAQFFVFVMHFLGSAGLLASESEVWPHMPPNLQRLAERGLNFHRDNSLAERLQEHQIEVHIRPDEQCHGWGFNVGVNTYLLPRVPSPAVRVFTWLLQGAAFMLASLALLLAWLEEGPSSFLVEAAYIDATSIGLMICSTVLFRRADVAQEEEDTWKKYHQTPKDADEMAPHKSSFLRLGNRFQQPFENFLNNTRVETDRQRVRIEENLRFFQERLTEGPARMQQNISRLREAAEPLLASVQPRCRRSLDVADEFEEGLQREGNPPNGVAFTAAEADAPTRGDSSREGIARSATRFQQVAPAGATQRRRDPISRSSPHASTMGGEPVKEEPSLHIPTDDDSPALRENAGVRRLLCGCST